MSARPHIGAQLAVVGIMGVAACALMAALTLSGTAAPDQRPWLALGHVLSFAVPLGVGLWAWYQRPHSEFGPLLVGLSFGWSLTTLAESDSSFLYSVGRTSLWVVEPLILYLMLAFPSGRLTARTDRLLVGTAVAAVAILFVPTAFLVESYPAGTPLSSCGDDCPSNFFMLLDSTPAFVDPVRAVREVLMVLLFLAVAVRLLMRVRSATVLMRRTLAPVLYAAIARCGAYVAFFPVRRIAPESPALDVIGWALVLTLPAIALGFLTGLVRWRLHVADAMEGLARSVLARPSRSNLRAAMAGALEDPGLEVAYRAPGPPGRWVGSGGATIDLERVGSQRAVTTVTDNGRPAVALIHDPALCEHRDFVDAVASVALFATENNRLTARLQASLRELEASRARIVAAADSERRRIERDLHDGAQQRLVALRIKLELADELMDSDSPHAHELLRQVEEEIEDALEDVRSLARGIYPSLLADQGLEEALRAAARRAPLPTRVACDGIARYPAEVESAVYFSCLEALQNVAKHARGATGVRVSVTANPALRFEVRDDGRGFDPSGNGWGQGLTNMRDRLAAVGGRLSVSSEPGDGTVVSGTIPARRLGTSAAAAPGEADTPADPHAGSLAASPIDGDHEALSGGETNRR